MPPLKPQQLSAYFYLALSVSLVGAYVALSKPLVAAFPVLLLAWMRFGIAGLAIVHWLKKPHHEPPLSVRTKNLLFLESFLGNFMFSICMLYGVSMTSAVSAGVIMASIPAAVALMSWAFLREKIGIRVWLSIALAASGIALASLSKPELVAQVDHGLEPNLAYKNMLWGNSLVFAAVLCEAAYAVIGKKLSGTLSAKRITSLINLWGFVLMTPMGLYWASQFAFKSVNPSTWVLLVFYALAASVWSVWLWMTGLRSVPAAQAGVFMVLLPIFAALVGVFVLGETVSTLQIIAFAICLAGVVLATLPTKARSF